MTVSETVEFLRENDNYLILTHMRPDGDTMGSASALCHGLRQAGKTAFLFPNPQFVDNHPWITEPYLPEKEFKGECVIAVDIAHPSLFSKGFKGSADLCIDHHPSNTGYAAKTLLKSDKASCGEIVMEVVKELCGGIDKTAADLLYIAVSTDTGCFVYGNTTGDTLQAGAELCRAGAANTALNKILFRTSSKERIKLEAMILSGFRYFHEGKTVFAVITNAMLKESGATENDLSDIAALPGRVEGGCVSAVIRENEDGSCKVSLRTNGAVNASEICSRFGGGGHAMAAGCNINENMEKSIELLAQAVGEALE